LKEQGTVGNLKIFVEGGSWTAVTGCAVSTVMAAGSRGRSTGSGGRQIMRIVIVAIIPLGFPRVV
jgi:hypothetical protein